MRPTEAPELFSLFPRPEGLSEFLPIPTQSILRPTIYLIAARVRPAARIATLEILILQRVLHIRPDGRRTASGRPLR